MSEETWGKYSEKERLGFWVPPSLGPPLDNGEAGRERERVREREREKEREREREREREIMYVYVSSVFYLAAE